MGGGPRPATSRPAPSRHERPPQRPTPRTHPSAHTHAPTVTREAAEQAESLGVKIFTADIIYHLFDQFTAYLKRVGGFRWVGGCRCGWAGGWLAGWLAGLRGDLSGWLAHAARGRLAAPQVKEEEQEAARLDAVFPCVLRVRLRLRPCPPASPS